MNVAMPVADENQGPSQRLGVVNPVGRLRQPGLSDADRNFAVAIHLSPLATAVFPLFIATPLVLWLIRKNESAFDDDHGREVLNLLVSCVIVIPTLMAMSFFTAGLAVVALVIWSIVIFIGMIRGAVAASNGEYFRYPMIFRFF